jgi:membrane associated rhomboid family serine protease
MLSHTPFTFFILLITVAASLLAFSNIAFQRNMILNPYLTHHHKQYHRLVGSGLIHADYMHLLFNMFTFYFFAQLVEIRFLIMYGQTIGIALMAALYFGAIIVANIPTMVKYKNVPHYNSLGASGGVAAIVFASILFDPLNKTCLYGFLCVPGFILGMFYVVYSYYSDKRSADNVNHSAHLYGAIFGFVFPILFKPALIIEFVQRLSMW